MLLLCFSSFLGFSTLELLLVSRNIIRSFLTLFFFFLKFVTPFFLVFIGLAFLRGQVCKFLFPFRSLFFCFGSLLSIPLSLHKIVLTPSRFSHYLFTDAIFCWIRFGNVFD